jgi:tetratricopeptide (TPR) repeat protein
VKLRRAHTIVAALFAVAIAAWMGARSRYDTPKAPEPARALSAKTKSPRWPVTTQGAIAMRNLEANLVHTTRRAAEEPDDVGACVDLSRLIYLRSRVTGEIDEMGRAVDQARECTRRHPESAEAWLAKALHGQTLHRFADARSDLARARKLGADDTRIASIERELDWNVGVWRGPAAAIRAEAERVPTVASVSRLARLEHDLRNYDTAEILYVRAFSLVEDTGPIQVAMVEVQRAINLSDAGRLADAEQAFRSAYERLPQYVAAKEHLGETLHRLGQDGEAVAIYEELTKSSSDPEFVGALAAIYRARGRVAEADALRVRATARYGELLMKYPEAMAWHASEYFAGEGNYKARARALLEKNAELRPTPDSLEALARIERDLGAGARADELTRRALAIRVTAGG